MTRLAILLQNWKYFSVKVLGEGTWAPNAVSAVKKSKLAKRVIVDSWNEDFVRLRPMLTSEVSIALAEF